MKRIFVLLVAFSLTACAGLEDVDRMPKTAAAQVGIVNHTGNYIYSAGIDGIGWRGGGGGNMSRWGAGGADVCCASIPRFWRPGMKGIVHWNMPIGRQDVIREKVVEVEKYDEPGDIYLHFFPNDEIRVIVSNIAGWSDEHPILPPIKPANAK